MGKKSTYNGRDQKAGKMDKETKSKLFMDRDIKIQTKPIARIKVTSRKSG